MGSAPRRGLWQRPQTAKMPRWNITKQVLDLLEEVFQLDKFPTADMRRRLATEFQVSPRQIQFWFQNRRQRERRSSPDGVIEEAEEADSNEPRSGLTPAKLSDLLVKLKEREKEAADTSGDNAAWGSAANDGFPAAVGLNASAGPVPGVLNSLTNGPHEGLTNGLSAGPNGLTNGLSGLVDGLANGAHAGLIGAPMSNSLSNSLCTSLTTSLNGSPSTSFKGSVSSEGPALDLKSFPALQLANEPGFGRMRLPPPHFQQIMRHLDVHAAGTRTCGGCCFSSMPSAGMEHAQCKFAAHDACAPTPLTPNDFSYRLPPQFEEYARMQAAPHSSAPMMYQPCSSNLNPAHNGNLGGSQNGTFAPAHDGSIGHVNNNVHNAQNAHAGLNGSGRGAGCRAHTLSDAASKAALLHPVSAAAVPASVYLTAAQQHFDPAQHYNAARYAPPYPRAHTLSIGSSEI